MDGPAFYDDEDVFAAYAAARDRHDNPNDTIEAPAFDELVGDVAGRRILDLGCGTAGFGREALARGAAGYVGVEGSRKMAAAARETLRGTAAMVIEQRVEACTYPTGAFDLVVSRLVLHYVADLGPVFAGVAQALVDGGRFVFSVEHPVLTSCDRARKEGAVREEWIVDGYFDAGVRTTRWLGAEVQKYHRTIEDYFGALGAAGFTVERLCEARPRRERFTDAETYERRKRIPLFLLLAGRKRG
jgi:SAM-dependent methyltransferase